MASIPVTTPLLRRTDDIPSELPLLEWIKADHARVSPARRGLDAERARMPDRAPRDGEQYRFHVDMSVCIGCKCCVVACNEQNGNPAPINWRRVGEIEGGWFPATSRSYLSMG
jgi:ferredoxin